MQIFENIKADIIPDFIKHFKLEKLVTDELLLGIAKKQVASHRYNDAARLIVQYKF